MSRKRAFHRTGSRRVFGHGQKGHPASSVPRRDHLDVGRYSVPSLWIFCAFFVAFPFAAVRNQGELSIHGLDLGQPATLFAFRL